LIEADGVITEILKTEKEKTITVLVGKGNAKTKNAESIIYSVPVYRTIHVKEGETVVKGQVITDGSVNLLELFERAGKHATERYIINEISKIYELQGAAISRKHIEIIVKQMFSRKRVIETGDTNLTNGMIVDETQLQEENALVKKKGGIMAKVEPVVMGITEVSLSRKSFLSAASFQHTNRVLINSAVRGSEDDLVGLMENVIIGRLIPAGTGFMGSPKQKMIEEVQPQEDEWGY